MIQLSFTKDQSTPVAIWFDLLSDPMPHEYPNHFYGYKYLTEEEVEEMLDDPFVTQSVKNELQDALT